MALREREGGVAAAEGAFVELPALRHTVRGYFDPEAQVLREQLQVGGTAEGGGGRCDQDLSRLHEAVHGEPLRQGGHLLPFVWGSVNVTITHREEVSPQTIYNLD